ncbi:MAG: RecX family transcriptional regulator [Clostridia bacterium]
MEFEVAKQKAIRYLILAKKTEYEVRNKLKKSEYSNDIIDQVIEYLLKIKYIDDNEYVDAYIRQCKSLLNYSIYEIKQKLLQKGIKKCIIDEKLEKLKETNYEKELIEKLINGKCKAMEELKLKQYLYRRGLSRNFLKD